MKHRPILSFCLLVLPFSFKLADVKIFPRNVLFLISVWILRLFSFLALALLAGSSSHLNERALSILFDWNRNGLLLFLLSSSALTPIHLSSLFFLTFRTLLAMKLSECLDSDGGRVSYSEGSALTLQNNAFLRVSALRRDKCTVPPVALHSHGALILTFCSFSNHTCI
jgi:hypothetical protein